MITHIPWSSRGKVHLWWRDDLVVLSTTGDPDTMAMKADANANGKAGLRLDEASATCESLLTPVHVQLKNEELQTLLLACD
eukprot:755863-Amphidinium_carterae.1